MGIDVQGLVAPASPPRKVYFTGYKNDESTAVATTALPLFGVVCFTESGGIKARGVDVTKPETNILPLFAGIVIDVSNPLVGRVAVSGDGSGVTAGNLIPGWITVVSASAAIQAMTKANMTKPSATATSYGFLLGPVNNSWNLEAITPSIGSGGANQLALSQGVAIALETSDTSSAAALKYVRLGGIVGGPQT